MINKLKELAKNKKILYPSIGALVILIIVLVIILLPKSAANNEKNLQKTLNEMGVDFYENYYYDQTGKNDKEKAQFVSKYKDIGIKIDLDNLSRYNKKANEEKIKEFINPKTNKECDKEKTKVTIYPKDPYGKKDYEIKVNLECGFEK